jgi:hypothetical protein
MGLIKSLKICVKSFEIVFIAFYYFKAHTANVYFTYDITRHYFIIVMDEILFSVYH